MHWLIPLAALLLLLPTAAAQQLERLRVEAEDAPAVAERLLREGYDVLEGTVGEGSFELVAGAGERAALEREGLDLETLEFGRPFREIQRERGAGAPEAVPAGYPSLAQIAAQMDAVAAAYPSICQVVDLTAALGVAPTWGGRPILAMKISDAVQADEDEPAVLLVSTHHSREIVTPVIALFAIERLTAGYGSDPAITQAVDGNEIWIVPVWNPDGYEHVFDADNLWRKNRRNNGDGTWGVDLNRNYPFGWGPASSCSGSSSTGSSTYQGPSAGSEPETATMLAFAAERRFAKLFDYHSSGREVRYGYGCLSHPWTAFLQSEATAFSQAGGYGGSIRPSCCTAGDIHSHMAEYGTHAFLWETHTSFQPSYASAQAEASLVWPGILALLQRPIPLSGHVTDACTGEPLEAAVSYPGVPFQNGERNGSGGPFGRYHAFLPPGSYIVRFSAPGYATLDVPVQIGVSSAQVLEVELDPLDGPTAYCTPKTSSAGCVPQIGSSGSPSASGQTAFLVTASGILAGKSGLLFYGFDAAAMPFQGGTLCVRPPVVRTGVQASGGTPPPASCTGGFSFDFGARIASGDPELGVGRVVYAQYWYRDPQSASGTGLSDGLRFTICR